MTRKLQTKSGLVLKATCQLYLRLGAWSGNLEIASLASTLDRPITVVHEQGQIFHFNPEGNRKDLFLYYSASAGHYECLKVPLDVQLSFRTKALPGQTKGGRKSGRGGMGNDFKSLGGHTSCSVQQKNALAFITAPPSCKRSTQFSDYVIAVLEHGWTKDRHDTCKHPQSTMQIPPRDYCTDPFESTKIS